MLKLLRSLLAGKDALLVVKTETVIGWQRKGFRLYWTWRSRRRRPGRPVATTVGLDGKGVVYLRHELGWRRLLAKSIRWPGVGFDGRRSTSPGPP
jgi:hypothetical protein